MNCARAGVAVGLVRVADAADGAEGTVVDGDLYYAVPDACGDLGSEDDAGLGGSSGGYSY